jgi:hypothetical protein
MQTTCEACGGPIQKPHPLKRFCLSLACRKKRELVRGRELREKQKAKGATQ